MQKKVFLKLTLIGLFLFFQGGIVYGNSLDEAYDNGGAGAGRYINVDSGAVSLIGSGEGDILYIENDGIGDSLKIMNMGEISQPFIIDHQGKIGIGVDHPQAEVEFKGDMVTEAGRIHINYNGFNDDSGIYAPSVGGNWSNWIKFIVAGGFWEISEDLNIAGNLQVGVNNPTASFISYGRIIGYDDLKLADDSALYLGYNSAGSGQHNIYFNKDGNPEGAWLSFDSFANTFHFSPGSVVHVQGELDLQKINFEPVPTENFSVNEGDLYFNDDKNLYFNNGVENFNLTSPVSKYLAGEVKINAGKSAVEVKFRKPFKSVPIVNVSLIGNSNSINQNVDYMITEKTEKGFKIVVNNILIDDFHFDWIAMPAY